MSDGATVSWLASDGEMASRIRDFDWSKTPVGPLERWPGALKVAVQFMLATDSPTCLCVGNTWIQIYNDSYSRLIGSRSARALGHDVRGTFAEVDLTSTLIRVLDGEAFTLGHQADRFPPHNASEPAWFDLSATPLRDETGAVFAVLLGHRETHERVVADRTHDEIAAFLDQIGKDLARLSSPDEIMHIVGARVGEFLNVSGCLVQDVDESRGEVTVHYGWTAKEVPSLKQTFRIEDYLTDEFCRANRAGEDFVVRDTSRDDRTDAPNFARLNIGAFVVIPFSWSGRWTGFFSATNIEPRDWRQHEIDLLHEVSDRLFSRIERARAEAALEISEGKYRLLFQTMDEGYLLADVIFDEDGRAVDIEYVESNPAAVRMVGLDLTGKRLREAVPGYEEYWYEIWGRVARTGKGERLERYAAREDIWYNFYVFKPEPDNESSRRVAVLFQDVSLRKRAEIALQKSEERHAFLLKLSDALRSTGDPDEHLASAMRVLCEHLGINRAQYYEVDPTGHYVDACGSHCEGVLPRAGRMRLDDFGIQPRTAYESGRTFVVADIADLPISSEERMMYQAAGTRSAVGVPIIKNGKLVSVLGVSSRAPRMWSPEDIAIIEETAQRVWVAADRARAEAALRESEGRFRRFVENVNEYAFVEVSPEGRITSWNPGAERLFGYSSAEVIGIPFSALVTGDREQQDGMRQEIEHASGAKREDAQWLTRRDGSRFWAQWVSETIYDAGGKIRGVAKVMRDETERQRSEEKIRRSLADKEELLKEVHHRVKNNLQVISSLVNLQAYQIDDPKALAAFEETRNRVYSIAAIHEMLYRSVSFEAVDVTDYARRLVPELIELYGVKQQVEADISGEGCLELERAVPYGLLLNELVSNVCKHAFPTGKSGRLLVSFRRAGGEIVMVVSDDGVGMPDGLDYRDPNSLGLRLVCNLARQMRATLELQSQNGTRFTVRIPVASESHASE